MRRRAAWARLGFRASQDLGEISVAGSYRGQPGTTRLRVASGRIAGLDVVWLQPLDGQGAIAEFLARHGEGIFSINYAAPSLEALDAEVGRLCGARRGCPAARAGAGRRRNADDRPHGHRAGRQVRARARPREAAVAAGQPERPGAAPAGDGPPFPARLSQYALVVEDLQAVSDYWARLGFPVMDVTHPALRDLRYHGEPGRFDQKLGWHRHGTVTWEWIQPLAGPTVYRDFLESHGEGVHHLALDVPDIDAAAKALEALGAPVVQSGAWGEKGKPGSGRFAYADTSASGGVTIELLWSKP